MVIKRLSGNVFEFCFWELLHIGAPGSSGCAAKRRCVVTFYVNVSRAKTSHTDSL